MRHPAVSGRFYSSDPVELRSEIEWCFRHDLGPGMPSGKRSDERLISAIAPHAGYRASGMNAAHTYKALAEASKPDVYFVIGPDHHGMVPGASVCGDPYVTPLGVCSIDEDVVRAISEFIPNDLNSHRFEHSVEVQIPFIQYIDKNAKVVPMIMGDQSIEAAKYLADSIVKVCRGIHFTVIASSDLSHYISRESAEIADGRILKCIKELDADGLCDAVRRYGISACGYGPMAVAMMMPSIGHASVLKYTNSWDSLRYDMNEVVAYCSAVMTETEKGKHFKED